METLKEKTPVSVGFNLEKVIPHILTFSYNRLSTGAEDKSEGRV